MILSTNRNTPMTSTLLVVLWAMAVVVVTVSGVRGQLSPLVAHPTWGPRPGQPPGATADPPTTPHFSTPVRLNSKPTQYAISDSDPKDMQQRPEFRLARDQFTSEVDNSVMQKQLRHNTQGMHKERQRDSEEDWKDTKSSPGLLDLLNVPLPTISLTSRLEARVTQAHVPRRRKQVVAPSLLKLTPPLRFLLHNEPSTPLPPFSSRVTKNISRTKKDSNGINTDTRDIYSTFVPSSARKSVDEGRGGSLQEVKEGGQGSSAPYIPSASQRYVVANRHRGLKSVWRDEPQKLRVARHTKDRRGRNIESSNSEIHKPSFSSSQAKHGCRKRVAQFLDRFERTLSSLLPSRAGTIPDEGTVLDESAASDLDLDLDHPIDPKYERHFERLKRQIRGTQCGSSSANAKRRRRKESRRSEDARTGKDGNAPNVTSRPPQASPGGIFIQLKDEDGRRAEADLYPSRRYSVLVDAPSDSLIVLSVVDGRGMGVGHLRPRRAAHMCHCGAHVVSLSTPFETRWEMPSSLPPSTVTFRLHYLHARGAGTRSVTHHVNRDEIARVGVRAASGKLIIQPNRTTHIHAPYGHTITLTPTNSRRGRVARSIGRRAAKDSEEGVKEAKDNKECSSSFIEITDSLSTWVTCSLVREPVRSSSNVLSVRARGEKNLYMQVESTGLEEASRACGWGWVALGNRCYLLVEYNATWPAAEASCVARGGNLAAVTGPQIADLLTRVTAAGAKYSPRAAYWVGASDSQYENSFTWTSGAPYSFSDWFPGWEDQGGYNSQPSDDGLGDEDCVELRRSYRLATKGSRATHSLYWNDRSCLATNYYICEKSVPGAEPLAEKWSCNRSLALTLHAPPTIVTSPGFPAHYPPSRTCVTTLTAPPAAHLVLQFDTFVLEPHPNCEYDHLDVIEAGANLTTRRCGDWTTRLKLLRHVSTTNRVVLRFTSDYAHDFPGFRARVSARTGSGCGDGREVRHRDMCYLLVPYPQVTWHTATHICRDMEGELAKVTGPGVAQWLGAGLRSLPDYAPGTLYWVGGTLRPHARTWTWQDGSSFNVSEPGPEEGRPNPGETSTLCLSLQERSASPLHKQRLHISPALSLSPHQCEVFGGYVCARRVPDPPMAETKVVSGYGGNISSPGYPSPYPNNLHLTVTLQGPANSRLVVTFLKLDLEYQQDCLYDYVGLQSSVEDEVKRFCGRHSTDMDRFDFVSRGNVALVTFHSDWSVVGAGARGRWRAVDTSGCPFQELTEPEGLLTSPNFPDFNLGGLDCTTLIRAKEGERVWLQFQVFEVGTSTKGSKRASSIPNVPGKEGRDHSLPHRSPYGREVNNLFASGAPGGKGTSGTDVAKDKCQEDYVEVVLGDGEGKAVRLCGHVSSGEVQRLSYVSYGPVLRLVLHTSSRSGGKGFQASYYMGSKFDQKMVLNLQAATGTASSEEGSVGEAGHVVGVGSVHALNFPLAPAPGVKVTQQLIAPTGHQLHLRLHNVAVLGSPSRPCDQDYVEVEDWYAGRNGTIWRICSVDPASRHEISIRSTFNTLFIREVHFDPEALPTPASPSSPASPQATQPIFGSLHGSSSSPPSSPSSSSATASPRSERSTSVRKTSESPPAEPFAILPSQRRKDSSSQQFLSFSIIDSLAKLASGVESTEMPTTEASDDATEVPDSASTAPFPTEQTTLSPNAIISNLVSDYGNQTSSPLLQSSSSSSLSSSTINAIPQGKKSWMSKVAFFSVTYEIYTDPGWLNRSMGIGVASVGVRSSGVATCEPSPCLNDGRCVTERGNHTCLCSSGYTGAFCQVKWCEMTPCIWGTCETGGPDGFVCVCKRGYGGVRCQDRVSPCDGDPCQSRGVCTAVNNTFHCQCHAWWEGERCESRMLRIPYKPLSERMFEEPFWLGLMTVAIVMGCIGVVFCIKKHFAEKIEKFFAEEIEKSKYEGAMSPAPSRLAPLPSPTGLSPRPRPKSLFVRLNSFRKASLLSLSSTASSPQCEAPAFTFDDLLKLHKRSSAASTSSSPRRSSHKCRSQTVSPRVDSKKILRHLVTPPVGHRASSFDEYLHLRTQTPKCSVERTRSTDIATELRRSDDVSVEGTSVEGLMRETSLTSLAPSPSRQDKKVTFAKLLEKMSKEMSSSSSDVSCAEDKSPSRIFNFGSVRRSPRRSPRIRHTQRYSGSGSEDVIETPDVSSSEMTPDPPKRLLSVKSSSSPCSKTSSPQSRNKLHKISSADSLLAMFRNFGTSGRPSASNPSSPHGSEVDDSSAHPSPSTTPTTPQKSLPQMVKQDTLTVPGALQVQVQCAGGLANSSGPVITLEVPNTDQYRCLSPITELPTPVPTPVPSPLPTPCRYRPKPRTSSESNDNKDSEDTESEFSLSISVERSSSDSSGPDHRVFFTSSKNLHSLHRCSPHRSETLSPTGATLTPSSTMSSRTPSPDTSPTISPVSSPKVKVKPPPLTIPNANVLAFNPEKPSTSSDPAYGEISLQVPVIKVDSVDDGTRWDSTPRTRSQSVDVGCILQAPLITISPAEEEHPSTSSSSQPPLVIPTLNVTLASPPALKKQYPPVPTISIEAPEPPKPPEVPIRRHAPVIREKTGSLELQPAPAITITNTLTDAESDTDSPTGTCRRGGPPSCYLSPFLGVDLRASESNLSSSGYSSAYSPGPSRCSSNNPLLPDEPMTPSVSSIPSRPMQIPGPPPAVTPPPRTKRRPLLKTPPTEVSPMPLPAPLVRTDSETTDDPAASSQPEADSALELDTNDECSDGVAHGTEASKLSGVDEAEAQRQRLLMSASQSFPKESPRLTRSPPSIVVHASLQSESSLEDCLTDKPSRLSPVSSRSESPISDSRLSVARIYPAFFGVSGKPELPYTDSDGLYDCPSSEVLNSDCHASASPLKRLGRKRLKRTSGKGIKSFLGLGNVGSGEGCSGASAAAPGQSEGAKTRLEPPHWERSPRRLSPKRRMRAQTSVDLLSSSNESITSQSPVGSSPGEHGSQILEGDQGRDGGSVGGRGRRRRPLLRGESIPGKHLTRQGSIDASGEETQEEQLMLRPSRAPEEMPRHRKVSRFRNFGNQIRFLRRLQLSRGAKDHLVSPAGSSDSDPECGPPEGSSRAPPSGRSSSSSKGTRSPCAQARYHPVNGGCVVRSSSS
ncbi:uncharacterized protein LOC122263022 isoform X3 [Penaeus japonicus]|uniref:uncharacterized protein LOC122263022 isoform X3 n=1 Tax=Penaeus japonicus TaxID=27405 RepID=UPI001C7179F9|nr:uncharacterized protein LOC122263022 isoform X3 [Penaeus japonicus]